MACRIVFEDDFIIVADKPAGLLTVPTPKNEKTTLSSLLKRPFRLTAGPGNIGLIVLAKTKRIRDILAEEFRNRRVKSAT